MADKRKRIYYTKAQITNGLKTGGGEWMYTDGTEYIGQYHRYTTGEVFTDASYVDGKSRILIPFVNLKEKFEDNELGIDFAKNFEYDGLKPDYVKKSLIPNSKSEQPKDKDYTNGYMIRYFAHKRNDNQIIELDGEGYGQVGTEDGLDKEIWEKFKIKWKISGPDNDVLDSEGNIKESGIIDTNIRTINYQSEDYPALKDYITDFRQFSKA
jgi:hypothetical protein